MTTRQVAALLTLALVWGASFLFIRVLADADVQALGISSGRTALGLATLVPFAWIARRQFPRDGRTWMALAGLGFANFALPWSLYGYGEHHVESGVASIINSGMPLWAAIFSVMLIRADDFSRARVLGLALGFGGVVAVMGGGTSGVDGESLRGMLAMVGATVCYAFSSVSIRRWLGHVPALPLTIGQIGFAACFLAPVALATGAFDDARMGAAEWGSLLTLGAAGSGFAVVIYMWLIGEVGAVRAAVVTYMMPPIGVTLGWLLLDEPVGWNLLVGLALIVAGVALVQGVRFTQLASRVSGRTAAAATAGE
ncbi:MAG: DMT family transporter [Dehalococcoidia bacterium]|nr:DMT family transporter [Chloroflexi bacterium CFX7]MCK6564212.1 DMT family transporter [Dehalococcoidia bacterium]MCL4230656.1 DMT family transporter [Dehalococcoidia bacterium]NUQ55950.1 DMT family transporter [Dehalococcoidia bacterium]RIL02486.1 MAG: EamA family transporter [bacterium]